MEGVVGVVLAGGRGTRMRSSLPKALHPVAEQPMVGWVLQAMERAGITQKIVVVGEHHQQCFARYFSSYPDVRVCVQSEPLGTAHAVAGVGCMLQDVEMPVYAASYALQSEHARALEASNMVVIPGDVPGIDAGFLHRFVCEHVESKYHLSLVAVDMANPYGYGRILQDAQGRVQGIVEECEARAEEKSITLCYSGLMVSAVKPLFSWLTAVDRSEVKGEYYLTDVVAAAWRRQSRIHLHVTDNGRSFAGVNTPEQRQQLQEYFKTVGVLPVKAVSSQDQW